MKGGVVIVVFLVALFRSGLSDKITDEGEAWTWFFEYGELASAIGNKGAKLSWAYATNITDYNAEQLRLYSEVEKTFTNQVAANASLFDYNNFQNSTLKKEFIALANRGWAALSDDEFTEINKLSLDLESLYGKGVICTDDKKKLSLEPELTEMLASVRDADKLKWIWKNWRDATGVLMREKYIRFTELQNKAAVGNGFGDTGESWRLPYAVEGYDFRADIEKLYNQLKPFYKELHTYVKSKLKAFYGEEHFPSTGHIPAHLLGNMWAQTWSNIEDLVLPYEATKPVNATPAIQLMTVRDMFNMSDQFFTSLGLEQVTPEFWNNSMLEKPEDGRDVVCHASAWDFDNGKDFRIKQCTRRNMEDFITVHHEMGHIQYYLQYKNLTNAFRGGANPGFHEAVGDVLALSVSTPEHLQKVGLIDSFETSDDSNINYMMSIALDKIVFLPFGKLMDDYRWALFDGTITSENLNSEWWKRRCTYQGISPPVKRTETDFDPGAKYHIPANVPYVRYFVSFVMQFQFHKALCSAANHTGPLHTCDIYQSHAAGEKLANMLKLGSSKEWTVALKAITGSESMSAEPLIEYFQPLMDWLREYNQENGLSNDEWTDECPTDLPEASDVSSGNCKRFPAPSTSSSSRLQHCSVILLVVAVLTWWK